MARMLIKIYATQNTITYFCTSHSFFHVLFYFLDLRSIREPVSQRQVPWACHQTQGWPERPSRQGRPHLPPRALHGVAMDLMVAAALGEAHYGTATAHLHLSTCTIKSRSVHSFLTCSRLATVVTGTYWSLSICDIRYMSLARFSLQKEDNLSWNLVRVEWQGNAPGLHSHAHATCHLPPLWPQANAFQRWLERQREQK